MNRKKIIVSLVIMYALATTNVLACQHFIKSQETDSSKKVTVIKQILVNNNQKINRNVILNNISQNSDPDLIINSNVEYYVESDSSLINLKLNKESESVEFKLMNNAYVKIAKQGSMVFNNETKLHLMPNSILEVSDSAVLHIKNFSSIQLDSSARLIVRGTGKIILEKNSELDYHPYSTIILQRKASSIHLNNGSKIILQNGLNLVYIGDGSVFIDGVEYYAIYGK